MTDSYPGILIGLLLAVLLVQAHPAFADEATEVPGQVITVRSDETVDMDFFSAAEAVVILGTINGDAYVTAGKVLVSGTIKGDLLALARDISVVGAVEGDIRSLGDELTISGSVGRNVTAVARKLELTSSASVGGGVVAAAEEMILAGPIKRNVRVMARMLSITSRIDGNLDALVKHMLLGPGADIRGNLTYKSKTTAAIDARARVGGEIRRKEPVGEPPVAKEEREKPRRIFGYFMLISGFLTTLLIGLLVVYLLPNMSRKSSAAIRRRPWTSLGAGFLAVFLPPVLIALLMVTVLGIPLGLMLLPLYIASLYFVRIFAIFWAGDAIIRRLSTKERRGLAVFVGCVIYYLLTKIPLIGGILAFFAVLLGFGAFLMANEDVRRGMRKQEAAQ